MTLEQSIEKLESIVNDLIRVCEAMIDLKEEMIGGVDPKPTDQENGKRGRG